MEWLLRQEGLEKDKIAFYGNKFFIGNGFMGIRGTIDEASKNELAAVNLAGLYDRVGDSWREPINAYNGFYTRLLIDDEEYSLLDKEPKETYLELDYRHGVLKRSTTWKTQRGCVTLETTRFACMQRVNLAAQRYRITADFHADITLVAGIDADVWDINGPHLVDTQLVEDGLLKASGRTGETGTKVQTSASVSIGFPCQKRCVSQEKSIAYECNYITEIGSAYEIDKIICVEHDAYMAEELPDITRLTYDELYDEQVKEWEKIWAKAEVVIEGDDEAMEALNYSTYHLYSIAPRHTTGLSIPARGLSGQTYKGAVFWDTEMFMMDLFLNTDPEIARNLLSYRIDGLKKAMDKARSYGFQGAFYAWESQEEGVDACSDYNVTDVFTGRPMRTYFKDKQVHISAAIVYAFARYLQVTDDESILKEGGAQVIFQCARFYYDLLIQRMESDSYEIHDVIGPDEYHERVNNNGYTNRMAQFTFDMALEVLEKGYIENANEWRDKLRDARTHIYIPGPNEEGIIPQFDGYLDLEDASLEEVRSRIMDPREYWGGAYGVASHTQIIKQADVVTWLAMFGEDYEQDIKLSNWQYYEPRTEHGSSLSSCMYSLLACECGLVDEAYKMFLKSAQADLFPGGKEWAGLIYIGGIHPAAHGGAYMVATRGFGGLSVKDGELQVASRLPKNWKSMKLRVEYQKNLYEVFLTQDQASLTLLRSTMETGR